MIDSVNQNVVMCASYTVKMPFRQPFRYMSTYKSIIAEHVEQNVARRSRAKHITIINTSAYKHVQICV